MLLSRLHAKCKVCSGESNGRNREISLQQQSSFQGAFLLFIFAYDLCCNISSVFLLSGDENSISKRRRRRRRISLMKCPVSEIFLMFSKNVFNENFYSSINFETCSLNHVRHVAAQSQCFRCSMFPLLS